MDAVFFDMDGLLVDTEKVWLAAETEVVGRLGGEWSREHQEQLVGGSWERTLAYILAVTGAGVSAETVGEWLLEEMVERLSAEVTVMPGALELLDELRAHGVRTALVTSSLRILAETVIGSVGLTIGSVSTGSVSHFEVVITADDVSRTKPHPEPYLTAASLLGVDPLRCAVLEDSPSGVAAATAAGCRVVAVPSVLPIQPGTSNMVVPSLTHVNVGVLRGMFA